MEFSELKARIFTLLREDKEFRYAVAGMLGLEEILSRLEKHDERFEEILQRLDRHEAELVKLREDMVEGFRRYDEILMMHTQELVKLREDMVEGFRRHDEEIAKLRSDMVEGFKRHDEILAMHAQELAKLREDMVEGFRRHDEELAKLRSDMVEGFRRHDEEIAKLREDMMEGFRRHDEEIAKLRSDMIAGFKRHDEEIAKLREDFNRMLRVIGEVRREQRRIRESQSRLERRIDSLEGAMISGFSDMSRFAGLTFEEFVRKFLSAGLRRTGEIPEGVELVRGFIDGEEVNLFLEDPLIVGEVTSYADSVDEIMKLLRKAELAKAKYSREPRKILVVLMARSDVAREIRRIAEEKDVKLIIGKIMDRPTVV